MKKVSFYLLIFTLSLHSLQSAKYVLPKYLSNTGADTESYQSVTFDGSWCWFSDPRAVYFEGKNKCTYIGWINSYGDVFISQYNHITGKTQYNRIFEGLEIDDHNNPSILIDKEGFINVFFSKHSTAEPIHYMRSARPEDITAWQPEKILKLNDTEKHPGWLDSYTYTTPVQLSAENDRMFLFWRGLDGKPTFSFSDDKGEHWSKGTIFILPEQIYKFRRPYVKIYSNGTDKIHIIFTDGHPRDEKQNSLYYMYYQAGAFYKANGQKIKNCGDLPITPREADVVYDATKTNQKAWIWDVAADSKGNPVVAYSKYPNDSTHIYCYSTRSGNEWKNTDLINSGKWFPQTRKGTVEKEPNYSGGICIDKESPNTLYLSVNRNAVFEIEKWTENGNKWTVESITKNSKKDNVRPLAVYGAKADNPLQLLWMQNTRYIIYGLTWGGKDLPFNDRYWTSIKCNFTGTDKINPLDSTAIIAKMQQVADWQLSNKEPDNTERINWLWGTFYVGLVELYKHTGDQRYWAELTNVGKQARWQPLSAFHADNLIISDVWASMYDIKPDEKMIDKSRFVLDLHLRRDFKGMDLTFDEKAPRTFEWWTWCDALYMAPQAFAHISKNTGDKRYLQFMDKYWWKTSDHLYSQEDSLFYRDDSYLNKRTKNGKKIFWGRGNGWVIGGLARVLNLIPANYPSRSKFEIQFQQMSAKMFRLQQPDGLWGVSLLDNEDVKGTETSASALITHALAWGINKGLIDRKYTKNVIQAWIALTNRVNNQGRLGYVQQVGAAPGNFTENQYQVYASGSYLLLGCEMMKLSQSLK